MIFFRRRKLDHASALRAVYRKSGLACLLTSLTTSFGMFALAIVPIPPIRYFGLFAGFGVLLPLMLDIWELVSKKRALRIAESREKDSLTQMFLKKLELYSYRYPKRTVVLFPIVLAITMYGVSKVRVDSNMVLIIKKGLPIREAHDLVDRVMGGTQNMEIFLDFKKQDALKDPGVLNAMERMQELLETEYPSFVVRTTSLVDVVKDSFKALNEGREEKYAIPQDRRMLEQTLLLFDAANPEDRQMLVPDGYSQGRISVRLLNYGSIEYLDFFQDVQKRMNADFGPLPFPPSY
ncbi:MAG: hypothetical protein GY866_03595 [Proteobacteria bacterium]|nr:hypothetical protein [Pseudomonadota bacterium]